MIAVALHQIRQVTLMPLVEETGIVVLRLLAPPHVERFVHDNQPHRVTHVQEFWGRRIVRTADRVHTHRLQLGEFSVHSVLIERGSETAEVVVLTDTIQLEVLAVEPEARLRIELEVAEASGGLVSVNYYVIDHHFRAYLIYIRSLTRP